MNQELYDILNEAGWRNTGLTHYGSKPGVKPWDYLVPSDSAISATDLINLLRLGGWDARPNQLEPTRVFVRLT
jgi:hypothetical protein